MRTAAACRPRKAVGIDWRELDRDWRQVLLQSWGAEEYSIDQVSASAKADVHRRVDVPLRRRSSAARGMARDFIHDTYLPR